MSHNAAARRRADPSPGEPTETEKAVGLRIAQERRLKGLRENRDVSQAEVAEAVGVAGPTLSRWEAGVSAPENGNLIALANYLGVTRGWLMFGEGPRTPPELPQDEPSALAPRPPAASPLEPSQPAPSAARRRKR